MIYCRPWTVVVRPFCHCLTCRQALTQMTITSLLQRYVALLAVLARSLMVYLQFQLQYPVCVCWPCINPICSAMWSAAGFCSGTSSIYSGLLYHFFECDSQLHKSNFPSDFPVLACCLKDCIEDVAEWTAS